MSLRMFMPVAALILAACADSPVEVNKPEGKISRNHAWLPGSLPVSVVSALKMSPNARHLVSGFNDASWHASDETGLITPLPGLPRAVNDNGVIVGSNSTDAVYWPSVSTPPIVLPALAGAASSIAWDLGPGTEPIIVGVSGGKPVRWDFVGGSPVVTELPSLGGGSARAINVTAGMIGGESGGRAAQWSVAGNRFRGWPVPGTVLDINSVGQMAGSGEMFGFILDNGKLTTIGYYFGYTNFSYLSHGAALLSITDEGVAVGWVADGEAPGRYSPVTLQFGAPPTFHYYHYSISRQFAAAGASRGLVTLQSQPQTEPWDAPVHISWDPTIRLAPDADQDGVEDANDNCPKHANDQHDADGDGFGDICDVAPIITAPARVFDGTEVRLRGSTYFASSSTVIYDWTFADGQTARGRSVTRTFESLGPQLVTLHARNKDGATGSATFTIDVVNAPPVVSIAAGHATMAAGTGQTLSISISDASPGETVSWVVDWGTAPRSRGVCGAPANCNVELSRTFTVPGTYRARIIATDSRGARRTAEVTFVVT